MTARALRRLAGITMFIAATARADGTLDVTQAMALAARQHPEGGEHRAAIRGADARSDVEHARYLPDVEVFAQLDRSTSNTSVGVLFPEPGMPVLSGTPGRSLGPGAFGTAAGATASWDVLGYRRWDAQIAAADADVRVARIDATVGDLELEFAAGDRFIAVVARDEAVKAARSGVDRARVFVTVVKALVDQNLRPGADLSRVTAELSIAETALIRAESAAQVSVAQLAESLGAPGGDPMANAGKLLGLPRRPTFAAPTDPRVAAAEARVAAATARRSVIETGTQPRLAVVGAIWARGGHDPGGLGAYGLIPDVPNWTLGVVLTWPVLAGKLVDPQARVEDANIAREQAHALAITQKIQSQIAQARAIVDGAYRVADVSPVALKSAREAEQQATARYQAKLATADDVAQAQRLLEQAEIDDAVARLEVWHAILVYAYAVGDLSLFATAYREAT